MHNNISDLSYLKSPEFDTHVANTIENTLFETTENMQKTAQTVGDFINDYLDNGRNMPIQTWLLKRFDLYPTIWESEQDKVDTAKLIIGTIENLVENQLAVEAHLQKGKTLANFLNRKIETVANQLQQDSTEFAQDLMVGVQQANSKFGELYLGKTEDLTPIENNKSSLSVARNIEKRLMLNANFNLGLAGAKSVGTRLWNAVKGKENLSRSDELVSILRSAVDSAENKGIQIAIAGGFVVSAKSGWVKNVFDVVDVIEDKITRTREWVSNLTLNVADGWNDLRIIDQVERGAIMAVDATKEKAKFTVAKVATKLEQASETFLSQGGKKLGEKIGASLGGILSPAGAAIGGAIGGFVGEKVGKVINDKVVKPLIDRGKKIANRAIDAVADTAKSVISTVKEGVESVWEEVKNSKLNPFNWF
ncbi:hypothetical protein A4G19_00730 [Pasteurellaceae bacterium Macca]|nr:hypothetical protein [Pasteurellaceae bacterium Macca]